MDQRPKEKPKRKDQKSTDKEQSERFKKTARKLGVEESGDKFTRVIDRILPARPARRDKSAR